MEGKWTVLSWPGRLRVPAMQNDERDDDGNVTGTLKDLGRYREQLATPQPTHMQHQTTTRAVHTQGSKHTEGKVSWLSQSRSRKPNVPECKQG